MAALGEHLARRGLSGADAEAEVFVGALGKPLDYSGWLHRVWQPACTAAGLEGLRFHDYPDLRVIPISGCGPLRCKVIGLLMSA